MGRFAPPARSSLLHELGSAGGATEGARGAAKGKVGVLRWPTSSSSTYSALTTAWSFHATGTAAGGDAGVGAGLVLGRAWPGDR